MVHIIRKGVSLQKENSGFLLISLLNYPVLEFRRIYSGYSTQKQSLTIRQDYQTMYVSNFTNHGWSITTRDPKLFY